MRLITGTKDFMTPSRRDSNGNGNNNHDNAHAGIASAALRLNISQRWTSEGIKPLDISDLIVCDDRTGNKDTPVSKLLEHLEYVELWGSVI